MHITPLDIGEAYTERMKKDIVLLLALQDPYYYTLAWNDSEKIDGAFHAEAYEHLGRGFRTAVKKHSIKEGLFEAWFEKWKERFRRRSNALRDINLMLLLYLYSCYLSCSDIRYIAEVLIWLINVVYQWFAIPEEPEYDVLNFFLAMRVPEVGFKIPENIYMLKLI